MGIVSTEEITNIWLQVCKFEPQITIFYVQSAYQDSTIYELGKGSKMSWKVAQSFVYFANMYIDFA